MPLSTSCPPSFSIWVCQWVDKILQNVFRYQTRHGSIECPCGHLRYTVACPPSSFALVEQTDAICHCDDCIGFATACPNSRHVMTKNHGTHLIQFYSCDIHFCSPGSDDFKADSDHVNTKYNHTPIGAVKLRKDTPLIRIYCKDCGTPIGAQVPAGGISLVYEQVLKDYDICFLPTLVLGFKDRIKSVTKPYSTTTVTVRQSNFGFIFLCRVICRVVLGLVLGKKVPTTADDYSNDDINKENDRSSKIRPGLWPFDFETSTIPVGVESINSVSATDTQNQKKER